jgi:hypothetical protein
MWKGAIRRRRYVYQGCRHWAEPNTYYPALAAEKWKVESIPDCLRDPWTEFYTSDRWNRYIEVDVVRSSRLACAATASPCTEHPCRSQESCSFKLLSKMAASASSVVPDSVEGPVDVSLLKELGKKGLVDALNSVSLRRCLLRATCSIVFGPN